MKKTKYVYEVKISASKNIITEENVDEFLEILLSLKEGKDNEQKGVENEIFEEMY